MMTEAETNPWGPTWYAATMVPVPERPALAYDLDVDVCVIGAGLAGLTVAREVARRGRSVAVLEARRVAWNASGRNGGFVSPGFADRIATIVDRVGLPRAKELWALSEAGVDYVRQAIRETAMPGVAPKDGRLSVRRTSDEDGLIRHAAMLRVDFGADVEVWPTEQVREVLKSRVYFQGLHFPGAFHVHALNYALGLAAAAEAAGARIFEATPAIELDPAGVRKRVTTPHARIRAGHVVLAGNVHLGGLDAQVMETVLPVSTYVAVTAPLGERLFEAVRYTGCVADTRRAGDYYRIVGDDRLMWGGRITTRVSTPHRLKQRMRRDMLHTYPQLNGAEIEYAWSGTMGYAIHRMPQIGELAPGYWLASAFGGHGLNTTAMAGDLIAHAIVEGDDRWRLFSPYELVWAGGRWGRVATQAIYWSMQARDAVEERFARARERWRERAAARAAAAAARKAAQEAAEEAAKEAARVAQETARIAAEQAKREAEDAARIGAEQAAREAADMAARFEAEAAERRLVAAVGAEPVVEPPVAMAPAIVEDIRVDDLRVEDLRAMAPAVTSVDDETKTASTSTNDLVDAVTSRAQDKAEENPNAPGGEPAGIAVAGEPPKGKKSRARKPRRPRADSSITPS